MNFYFCRYIFMKKLDCPNFAAVLLLPSPPLNHTAVLPLTWRRILTVINAHQQDIPAIPPDSLWVVPVFNLPDSPISRPIPFQFDHQCRQKRILFGQIDNIRVPCSRRHLLKQYLLVSTAKIRPFDYTAQSLFTVIMQRGFLSVYLLNL